MGHEGRELRAGCPAEGGVSLCQQLRRCPGLSWLSVVPWLPVIPWLSLVPCLSLIPMLSVIPWLSIIPCHSQQCQGAGEGSTSSSTKPTPCSFHLSNPPFSVRFTLEAVPRSSLLVPYSLVQDVCMICSSQPTRVRAGCTLVAEPCLPVVSPLRNPCYQLFFLLQRWVRSVLASAPPTQMLALQLQRSVLSVRGPSRGFIMQ